jgi:hypothetical protein
VIVNEILGFLAKKPSMKRGHDSQVAGRLNDVRDRLSEYLNDEKITQSGYDAILSAVEDLAASIAPANNGNGQQDICAR